MMFRRLFPRRSRETVVARLLERVATASRRPHFYRAMAVPDTIEGRFEMLVLHLVLVLRLLRRLPPPADDVGQDLVDAFFRTLEASLRETGIGDGGVPRRMKGLAGAFYGRAAAYDAALDAGDRAGLARALERNVAEGRGGGEALSAYAIASERALAGASLEELLRAGPGFPQPGTAALVAEVRP